MYLVVICLQALGYFQWERNTHTPRCGSNHVLTSVKIPQAFLPALLSAHSFSSQRKVQHNCQGQNSLHPCALSSWLGRAHEGIIAWRHFIFRDLELVVLVWDTEDLQPYCVPVHSTGHII